MTGIYSIINTDNGQRYIGQAINIKRRITKHFSELRSKSHHCEHLQRAFNKYGEANFKGETIESCEINNLTDREQYWIDYYKDSGIYNAALYAGGSCLGVVHSKESRERVANALKGRKHSEESRKRQSIAQTGKKRGKRPPFSAETRAKMSLAKKGKPLSKEHKSKISASLIGNTRTLGYKYGRETDVMNLNLKIKENYYEYC